MGSSTALSLHIVAERSARHILPAAAAHLASDARSIERNAALMDAATQATACLLSTHSDGTTGDCACSAPCALAIMQSMYT